MMIVSEKLNQWVHKQINNYGWSMRELGRRSGLSPSYISDVLAGKQEPGAKFYRGISKAFDMTIESIERLDRDGTLPEDRSDEQTYRELLQVIKKLTSEDLKEVLDYAIHRLKKSKSKSV